MEPPPPKRARRAEAPASEAIPPPPPPPAELSQLSPDGRSALAELPREHLGVSQPERTGEGANPATTSAPLQSATPWRPPQHEPGSAVDARIRHAGPATTAGPPAAADQMSNNDRALQLLHSLRRVLWKATELMYDLDSTLQSLSQELNPDAPSSQPDPCS